MTLTIIIAFLVLLINIPFGYWRGSTKKFSLPWFISIHLPVIISIALRHIANIEFQPLTIVLFITAFFLGQLLGKQIYVRLRLSSTKE